MAAALLLAGCAGQTAPDELLSEGAGSDPLGPKRIALTYDDAPMGDGPVLTGRERTDRILAALDSAGVPPVAIFATTRGMDEPGGRARMEAYAEAGHLIANHSHTHPHASRMEVEAYLADLDAAEERLRGLPNRRAWFRFPFLDEGGYGEDREAARARRDALRAGLAERGLMSGYVTVDTYDWHLVSLWRDAVGAGRAVDLEALETVYADMVVDAAEHYDGLAIETLGRRPAQVLLLHENDLAAEFTEAMVEALQAEGWEIVSPDVAFADPIADVLPDTLFAGMGRVAAIAHDGGARGAEVFDHWSASREGIEARTEAAGAFGEAP